MRMPMPMPMPATFFGRLALLLVVAVLASHVMALTLMFEFMPHPPPPPLHPPPPSLVAQEGGQVVHPLPPPPGPGPGPAPFGGGPWPPALWLDIGVRLGALLLAAWVGARWLSAPVRHLAQAAQALGANLDHPPIPEAGPTECRDAIRVFNAMQASLRLQVAERERFLAAVSHDLRTPLTRMRLRVEALPEGSAHQAGLHRDVAEMQSLVHATLAYLSGSHAPEAATEVDMESLVRSLADDEGDCGHTVHVAGQAAPLRGQPQALRRCLDNVVGIAIRYGGEAQVTLIDSPSQLVVQVLDAGPGLPPEELSKVLSPFYRVDASRHRDRGGVGLGLSIASDIVRRHGGTLTLANAQPQGLRVTLAFPRTAV